MAMRILHTSDLHIGKKVNNYDLLEDQQYVLQQIVDRFGEDDIDALVIAGDLYDTKGPSSDVVGCVDWFLTSLSQTNKPVFIVAGNHDSPERVAYGSSLLARQNIYVSPVFDGEIKPIVLNDEFGPVNFWLIPFVRPQHVRAVWPEDKINNYTDALNSIVSRMNIDTTQRNVVLVHQFVVCGSTSPETSESETISLGSLDNVNASIFDDFDYVAMGHIHRPQQMGRPTCRYSGSILKYSFSEARDTKSCCVVDLSDKNTEVEVDKFVLNPLHDMREIKGDIDTLLSQDVIDDQNCEDYLHITLTDDEVEPDKQARLRHVYPRIMAVDYDNSFTYAQGIQGEYADIDSDKTVLEHFKDFFLKQVGSELNCEQEKIVVDTLREVEED